MAKKDDETPPMPTAEFVSMARRLADFVRPIGDIVAFAENLAVKDADMRKMEARAMVATAEYLRVRTAIEEEKAQAEKDAEAARALLDDKLQHLADQYVASEQELARQQAQAAATTQDLHRQLDQIKQGNAETLRQMAEESAAVQHRLAALRAEEQALRERLTAALR